MIEYQYIGSTILIIIFAVLMITMIYMIRSNMSLTKGPYSWISNLCIFTLFLLVILSLFLGLTYVFPFNAIGNDVTANYHLHIDKRISQDNSLFSLFLSKYAMFPVLLVEVVIYVVLNGNLLWTWFSTGEWDSIVNKFFFLQRIWGILYMVGCATDFWIRLYRIESVIFLSMDNSCACWMIFYKGLFYAIMTSQFTVAVIRYICIKYPIEYHNRSVEQNHSIIFLILVFKDTQMKIPKKTSLTSF